jgi:hypothetical protein
MESGVYVDKEFEVYSRATQGENQFSCFVQKLKNSNLSRILGTWNRKFIFLNLLQKNLYYSSGPSCEAQTEIKMRVGSS